ncbi:MAG: hypothetical protein ACYCV4_06595 [Dermatophilaceae bacterium]
MAWTPKLQRRATAHGSALTSTMAHPGIAVTGLVVDRQDLSGVEYRW